MVPFVLPRAICGVVAVLCLLTGCSPGQPITGPSPLPSSATSTPQVDLTAPGAAEKILSQLLRASGSSQVIMIEVRRQEAGALQNLPSIDYHEWALPAKVLHLRLVS